MSVDVSTGGAAASAGPTECPCCGAPREAWTEPDHTAVARVKKRMNDVAVSNRKGGDWDLYLGAQFALAGLEVVASSVAAVLCT